MNTVGHRLWQETLKNVENDTQTLYYLEYGEKHWKYGTWWMHTVGPRTWQENWKLWKMKNTRCRTWNMARNTERRDKCESHNVGPELWRENWETSTVWPWISEKTENHGFMCLIFHFFHFSRFISGIKYTFLIFHVFPCFYIPGPAMWVSPFPCWSVFSPYSRFYSVHFSFFIFSVFLAIFQLIQCCVSLSTFFSVFSP